MSSHEDVLFSAETLRQILSCETDRLADDVDWCVSHELRERASRVLLTQNRLQLAAQVLERVIPRGPSPIELDYSKLIAAAAHALAQMTQAATILDGCLQELRGLPMPVDANARYHETLGRLRAPIEGIRGSAARLDPLIPVGLKRDQDERPHVDLRTRDDILGGTWREPASREECHASL